MPEVVKNLNSIKINIFLTIYNFFSNKISNLCEIELLFR
jgi:hypothetical protein